MANDRSYEGMERGQMRYKVLEFCSSEKALWGKVESGQYDWLGVKDERSNGQRTFVVGRPSAGGITESARVDITHDNSTSAHRVETRSPLAGITDTSEYPSANEAQAFFTDLVSQLKRGDRGPGIWKAWLFTDSALTYERVIVFAPPNYGTAAAN